MGYPSQFIMPTLTERLVLNGAERRKRIHAATQKSRAKGLDHVGSKHTFT